MDVDGVPKATDTMLARMLTHLLLLPSLFAVSVCVAQPEPAFRLSEGAPSSVKTAAESALGKYVAEDDGAFKWELVRTTPLEGMTLYDIRLTSQRWRTAAEVSEPVWTHWLTVGVPHAVRRTVPIMLIDGGSRREEPRTPARAEFMRLVQASGAVCCAVDNIPNQPLAIEDGKPRREDDLLSQSWNLAIKHDDSRWIGRFPMVKAVKRAMDATEQFLAGRDLSPAKLDGKVIDKGMKPEGFFVTGASKRGWTTWLIAAVDPRVKAIAPIVIDVLNMEAQTPHHWASYGFWAPALRDYVANGIDKKFGTPELNKVIAHEDPLAYMKFVERVPKYIVTATGDEFFPTDSFQHYEKQLSGEWRVRSVPNAGHNLAGSMAPFEILAFYTMFVEGKLRPELTWTLAAENGKSVVTAKSDVKPERVLLWQCDAKARDFRIDQTGRTWTSSEVVASDSTGLVYSATVEAPATGFRAFMMEATFASGNPVLPFTVTTRVFITPDTLPFATKK